MPTRFASWLTFFAGTWAAAFTAASLFAAEPTPPDGASDTLVQQALQADLKGDQKGRGKLLADAKQSYPGYAPARWQSGEVRVGESWVPVAAAEAQSAKAGTIAMYRQLREQTP